MANVKNRPLQGKKKHQPRRPVLLVATGNRHKLREIARILGRGFRVFGLERLLKVPRIAESGRTFDANAAIKVKRVRDAVGREKNRPCADFVIADDSGLRATALGGEPGIRSARYAGPAADDRANRRKLLRRMKNAGDRRAEFLCVIALADMRGARKVRFFRGRVRGRIVREEQGSGGFGYDPVFVPRGFQKTFAQLSATTKNRLSHRAKALARLNKFLEKGSLLGDVKK